MAEKKNLQKAMYQEFADDIIAKLKEGTAPWQKPWNPVIGADTLPFNPHSKTRYRGMNALKLYMMSQEHGDPRWMTYKQTAEAGYQVRKGEKGTSVIYWQFKEYEKKDDNGQVIRNEDGSPKMVQRPIFRYYTVFNAKQIENYPELKREPPSWKPIERAEDILKGSGAKIFHDQGNRNFYRPSTDDIHLTPPESYDSADKYYATALHELSHWTGHPDRLNRGLHGPFGSEDYAREELRAEIGSWMLGNEVGVGHDPSQHLAYVDSWIKAIEKDPAEIVRACADAEKIMNYLLDRELNKEKLKTDEIEAPEISNEPTPEKSPETDGLNPHEAEVVADRKAVPSKEAPSKEAPKPLAYLTAGFREKDQVKALGAKWDGGKKKWYCPEGVDPKLFEKFLTDQDKARFDLKRTAAEPALKKTYLSVSYKERAEAKALGAFWDSDQKLWYAPEGTDMTGLKKFLPDNDRAVAMSSAAMPSKSPARDLADKMEALGFDLEGQLPIIDGQRHRCKIHLSHITSEDKDKYAHTKPAEYCFYDKYHPNPRSMKKDAGLTAGYVKCFTTSTTIPEKTILCANGVVLSNGDTEKQRAERLERVQIAQAQSKQRHDFAAEQATKFCKELCEPVHSDNFPKYLETKGFNKQVIPGVRRDNYYKSLIVPIQNTNGDIRSYQWVSDHGSKGYAKDGEKTGNFHLVGQRTLAQYDNPSEVVICEGFATALTLRQAIPNPDVPVIAAMDAYNLGPVAQNIQEKWPGATLTICADNDLSQTPGQPGGGEREAIKAAQAVGGRVKLPDLTDEDKANGLTDFNDLAVKNSPDRSVKNGIMAVKRSLLEVKHDFTKEKAVTRTVEKTSQSLER